MLTLIYNVMVLYCALYRLFFMNLFPLRPATFCDIVNWSTQGINCSQFLLVDDLLICSLTVPCFVSEPVIALLISTTERYSTSFLHHTHFFFAMTKSKWSKYSLIQWYWVFTVENFIVLCCGIIIFPIIPTVFYVGWWLRPLKKTFCGTQRVSSLSVSLS